MCGSAVSRRKCSLAEAGAGTARNSSSQRRSSLDPAGVKPSSTAAGAPELCDKTGRRFAEVLRNARARKPAARLRMDLIYRFPQFKRLDIQVNNDRYLIVNCNHRQRKEAHQWTADIIPALKRMSSNWELGFSVF